jgi:hypothetical protein
LLFQRFLARISEFVPDRLAGDSEALSRLNPDKFYLENVRSVLGVSSGTAQRICDAAVRQGAFQKRIEVVCPNGAVAASAADEEGLPETVRCWAEDGGGIEETYFETSALSKTVFYRLNDEESPRKRHAEPA